MQQKKLSVSPDVIAPDGSEVRILASSSSGSMAHFSLHPGQTSKAIVHKTVEEIWFILSGQGRMWRRLGNAEDVTQLSPGLSLTIPVGCHFQFRCDSSESLKVVAATMPPWPGEGEAEFVKGKW